MSRSGKVADFIGSTGCFGDADEMAVVALESGEAEMIVREEG